MRWGLQPLLIGMLCFSALPGAAQGVHPPDSLADTSAHTRPVRMKSAATPHVDSLSLHAHPKKSPGNAMLFSAILPGAGQFYNESYWKVPIVFGFGLYFVSSWLDNNRRYADYRDKYSASLAQNPAGDPRLLAVREFYKEQRDSFTWYFLILYLLNIADAYVDASLYDFNVGGDLSLRLLPPPTGVGVGIRVQF
jgi:hypothetical protein